MSTDTACPYCGVGCGVAMRADASGVWRAEGAASHPANFGRLCSKGAALGETLGEAGRLLFPSIGGRRTSWAAVETHIAGEFSRINKAHGPGAIGFYLSGQLLTEDYYAANKLAKGFIGTPHVDTNSRLCMASAVAAHTRSFGADVVPACYEDLDCADLVVAVGANPAWCHPVLWQRVLANAKSRGARIVSVDVRGTATSTDAHLALTIAPGSDVALFAGLLRYLAEAGATDAGYIARHTAGFEAALVVAPSLDEAARICAAPEDEILRFWRWFAQTPASVTCFSMGVNQSAAGTDKANAIINVHLATGRVGRLGASPFSLTGQPNAMGGREVGGMAHTLAAHMGYTPEAIDRVRRFWRAPAIATHAGLKASAMFEAAADGEVKALWIASTNPAVSLPDLPTVRRALERAELVIVQDAIAETDTARFAHVLLPAAAWGEKDGTVTNSERRISRQRAFLPPPGEARADWAIFAGVARAMGFHGFDWRKPGDVFAEHAALTSFENGGARPLDLTGIAVQDYEALRPVQWGGKRMFGNGRFATTDERARFVAVAHRPPVEAPRRGEIILSTGRIRDQWHTMTRSGRSARLASHRPEPFVEVNPSDAARLKLLDDTLAQLSARGEACVMRVRITADQPEGRAFAAIHWSDANASAAKIGGLIAPHVCSVSGQPELKAAPISLSPFVAATQGVLVTREVGPPPAEADYWSRRPVPGGFATMLAFAQMPDEAVLGKLLGGEIALYADPANGVVRAARMEGGQLLAALSLAPAMLAADTLIAALSGGHQSPLGILSLSGCSASGGPVVCACNGVTAAAIVAAFAAGARDVAGIGRATLAGTGCGSCVPEIRKLIENVPLAAE